MTNIACEAPVAPETIAGLAVIKDKIAGYYRLDDEMKLLKNASNASYEYEAKKAEQKKTWDEILDGLQDDEIKAYFCTELIKRRDFLEIIILFEANTLTMENFIEPLSGCVEYRDQLWIMDFIPYCKTRKEVERILGVIRFPHLLFHNTDRWPRLSDWEREWLVSTAGRLMEKLVWEKANQKYAGFMEKKTAELNQRIQTLDELVCSLKERARRYEQVLKSKDSEIDGLKRELERSPRNRADGDLAKVGLDSGTMAKVGSVAGKEGTIEIVKGMQKLMARVVHPDFFSEEKKKDAEEILKMVNAAVTKILGEN